MNGQRQQTAVGGAAFSADSPTVVHCQNAKRSLGLEQKHIYNKTMLKKENDKKKKDTPQSGVAGQTTVFAGLLPSQCSSSITINYTKHGFNKRPHPSYTYQALDEALAVHIARHFVGLQATLVRALHGRGVPRWCCTKQFSNNTKIKMTVRSTKTHSKHSTTKVMLTAWCRRWAVDVRGRTAVRVAESVRDSFALSSLWRAHIFVHILLAKPQTFWHELQYSRHLTVRVTTLAKRPHVDGHVSSETSQA
jgi:hypothetical protein